MTEDEMVGWYHQCNGHEFEQALGVGDGQGSLSCCSPWGRKESDTTELNWVHPWSCRLPEVALVFHVFYEGADQILLPRWLRHSGTEALPLPPKMWPEVALASFSHRTAAGLEQRALQRLTVTYAISHTVGAASIEDCHASQSQLHKACSCIFHRNSIQDNDPASCSGLFIQQPTGKPSQASGPRKYENWTAWIL